MNKIAGRYVSCTCFFLFLTWIRCVPAISQEMPVPAVMQASLFKKIFAYDKKLSSATDIKVAVVFSDSSAGVKDEIVKAFESAGISAKAFKADQIAANAGSLSAIYLTSGAESAKAVCQKNQVLCITGLPSLVESGTAAIGLGVSDNKPKIWIHLGELKAEGHEVSANLLQLAKVIG